MFWTKDAEVGAIRKEATGRGSWMMKEEDMRVVGVVEEDGGG